MSLFGLPAPNHFLERWYLTAEIKDNCAVFETPRLFLSKTEWDD
jgi:hypothetical protein